jgi:glutamate/tyrosine decarboxylase-like PLP-dependent enzyme
MRALGYRVVDLIVDHFASEHDRPVGRVAERETLDALLREPMPEAGRPAEEVLERVRRDVLPFMLHVDHQRFFGFVPGPSNFVGAMADAITAGLNVFQGTWLASSGPSEVELVTTDWLRAACGLPAGAGGLFVSGGSVANITALGVARHLRLGDETAGAVVYLSEQTHSSVERGLALLGFAPAQIRRLPCDDGFRLDVAALRRAVAADRATGLAPFCVVANAGTTNTGAIDPLPEMAEYCEAEGLWLHADGAFGAATVLSPRGRALLEGLDRVHSLSIDPHKWLFQPFECGCVLVRDARWLAETFAVHPEYLQDTQTEHGEVNFAERGIQLTRRFRALKLWMSLQVFGRAAFAEAIERGFALAERAEALLDAMPGWAIVSPAQLGTVCFRRVWPGVAEEENDRRNAALVELLLESGFAFTSSTRIGDRTVLRLCTINPRTREADIEETVVRLDALATARWSA